MPQPTRCAWLAAALLIACASDRREPPTAPAVPAGEPSGAARDPGAGYEVRCNGHAVDVRPWLLAIASDFEARRLPYDRTRMQDCSGMFHRSMARFAGDHCPEAATRVPDPVADRSSDAIARYYAAQSTLVPVSRGDELRVIEEVRPGAVMFFGPRSQIFRGLVPGDVPRHVRHVGIVVEVVRDGGAVVSYAIFHGRSPGRPAAITRYHVRTPRRADSPPFGNGREQWIGYAPLVPGAR